MRLAVLATTAAFLAVPGHGTTKKPQTFGDLEIACRGGSQKACAEADRIRSRVTQGTPATGAEVPSQPAAGGGPGTPKEPDKSRR
jgi:hypothetical protein